MSKLDDIHVHHVIDEMVSINSWCIEEARLCRENQFRAHFLEEMLHLPGISDVLVGEEPGEDLVERWYGQSFHVQETSSDWTKHSLAYNRRVFVRGKCDLVVLVLKSFDHVEA